MSNLVVGSEITFTEGVFGGSYRSAKHLGDRTIHGRIVRESYGGKRGQHTFTIEVIGCTGEAAEAVSKRKTIRRLGRNVYRDCTVLSQPTDLSSLAEEKASRAEEARQRKYFAWAREAIYEHKTHKLEKIPGEFWAAHPDLASQAGVQL